MLTATVCVALSGAGLAVALLTGWRRRFRRAVRIAAVSLLPVGLYLAGLITLGRRVGLAVGDWAAGLVLRPTVWAGFAVLALAVLLYLASRIGRHRSAGRDAGPRPPEAVPGSGSAAIAPAARTGRPDRPAKRPAGEKGEFDEIEEILRKRGI